MRCGNRMRARAARPGWACAWALGLLLTAACEELDPVHTTDLCEGKGPISANCPRCKEKPIPAECSQCLGPDADPACSTKDAMHTDGTTTLPDGAVVLPDG